MKNMKMMSRTQKVMEAAGFLILTLLFIPALRAQNTGLARTPPMGWNSWYAFRCKVTETIMRAQADAMASNGMKAAGYEYVNIDDCWAGPARQGWGDAPERTLRRHEGLGRLHSQQGPEVRPLLFPGTNTCAGFEGSLGHEEQDARTYAAWGADFLKYDYCRSNDRTVPIAVRANAPGHPEDRPPDGVPPVPLTDMDRVWRWGASAGGNLWRTTYDIQDRFGIHGPGRLRPERPGAVRRARATGTIRTCCKSATAE